jgi:hypothetical protein
LFPFLAFSFGFAAPFTWKSAREPFSRAPLKSLSLAPFRRCNAPQLCLFYQRFLVGQDKTGGIKRKQEWRSAGTVQEGLLNYFVKAAFPATYNVPESRYQGLLA